MNEEDCILVEGQNRFKNQNRLRMSPVKFSKQESGQICALMLKGFMSFAFKTISLSILMESQSELFALYEKYLQFEIL